MTARRIGILAAFVAIILGLFFISNQLWSRHLVEVQAEEERIAQKEAEEAAKEAQETLEAKLKAGNFDNEDLKVVFLTFDDGPDEYTDEVLDILSKEGVKATFFADGDNNPDYVSVYKRIVSEGHTLGDYCYIDSYSEDPTIFLDDLKQQREYLKQSSGQEPAKVIRFPGGSDEVEPEILKTAVDNGYNYVDWNVELDNQDQELTQDELFKQLMDNVHKQSVSVVLAHSENAAMQTSRQALEAGIKQLKNEGYTFLPIKADYKLIRFVEPENNKEAVSNSKADNSEDNEVQTDIEETEFIQD